MSLLDMLLLAAIDPISLLELFVVLGFLLWPVAFSFMLVWFVCCCRLFLRVASGYPCMDSVSPWLGLVCCSFLLCGSGWCIVAAPWSGDCHPYYSRDSHPLHVPLIMGVQVEAAISLLLHPIVGVDFGTLLLLHLLLHLMLECVCFGCPSLCSSGGCLWVLC